MSKKYIKRSTIATGVFMKPIQPKNSTQEFLLQTVKESTVTFCTGPAGTGKTFLLVYSALVELFSNNVSKIIITRPVMEAGENLGFLPGDLETKLHPYLLPILDSLEEIIGVAKTKTLMEEKTIEIAPLAFMRGRSFNRSFILLDEAQNTTVEQMKMFLTRLGYDSKMVVNGDVSQSDLPRGMESGLNFAHHRLVGIDGEIGCVEFTAKQIVRNPLIARMIQHLEGPAPTWVKQIEPLIGTMSTRHSFFPDTGIRVANA